ncbi:MAG TPA: hypothetical protein VF979_05535 [Streptosporangiaceae bacterium]
MSSIADPLALLFQPLRVSVVVGIGGVAAVTGQRCCGSAMKPAPETEFGVQKSVSP